jgi:hypothetical protein
LRLEARIYVVIPLDDLRFFVAQGIFGSLKSLTKVVNTRSILFCLFASFLAGIKLFLLVADAFLGKTQCLWKKERMRE